MKYFVVFLFICGLATSYAQLEEVVKKAQKIAGDCKEEVGATDADVEAMFKHEPAGNDKAKCLNACVLKNFGFLDADNKLVKDVGVDFLKSISGGDAAYEKLGTEILDACKDTPAGGNNCETSEALRTCLIEKSQEKGFKLPF
ncbi:general odorant-binding protein 28a-like [Rhagoletis pomonella]|uniref:general odorant-binding protein 28a-like n=1 Tax=Rhagoletis pomonella TaxID=28610 RepID=UPI001786DD8C|nr:general odorant-binding protein 28a-like [Rhagoletis pomonella]